MKHIPYTLQFFSYWLQLDKEGQHFATDHAPVTEKGLPIYGGKALKGVLKDQLTLLAAANCLQSNLFQPNGSIHLKTWSAIKVGTASISDPIAQRDRFALTDTLTHTAIDDTTHNALQGSLRTTQAVIPLTLQGSITINTTECTEIEALLQDLQTAASMIKEVGYKRYLGMGRCKVTLHKTNEEKKPEAITLPQPLSNGLALTITATAPLVLRKHLGTEVKSETIEYISGNKILGIVAAKIFKKLKNNNENALLKELFFSGNVQFTNGYPTKNNAQGLPVPFTLYQQEDGKLTFTPAPKAKKKAVKEGYLLLTENTQSLLYFTTEKNERLKSARDIATRASKDESMYIYGFVKPGTIFKGYIYNHSKNYHSILNKILPHVSGEHYLGTSKGEFGRVHISIEQCHTPIQKTTTIKNETVTIYAKSAIVLLDEVANYTTQIMPQHFGLKEGTLNYKASAIIFTTFSRFSGVRQQQDRQRIAIKAGSVIVFDNAVGTIPFSVGVYQVEGCGQLLVNPAFLKATSVEHLNAKHSENTASPNTNLPEVTERATVYRNAQISHTKALHHVARHKDCFTNITKSQWGAVRKVIETHVAKENGKEKIEYALFGTKNDGKEGLTRKRDASPWEDTSRSTLFNIVKQENFITLLEFVVEMAKETQNTNHV